MAQLNQMQRYAICLYLKDKKTQAYIAEQLKVSQSTISLSVIRNLPNGKVAEDVA